MDTLIADETLTAGLARMLAATTRPGQTLLLEGPVGAGKTHFARAFIRARQGDAAEDVPSPTFTLVQTYDDPMGTEIWHADLYRLTDASELTELGLDEALDEAICLIEWPDRLDRVPKGAIWLRLANLPDPALRRIDLAGDDPRIALCAGFLHRAGWSDARVMPLAGDASARRYFRLEGAEGRAVLMDDPGGSMEAFLAMTHWLRGHGFGAPAILTEDAAQGLALVEDLGDDLLARVLERQPDLAPVAYARIADLLAGLHRLPVPEGVPPLNAAALADQVGLFAQFYLPAAGATAPDIAPIIAALHRDLAEDVAPVVALRDLHAENLIWRGAAPLGLIDYQDAVAAHPAYDLVSALQDARRDVAPDIAQATIRRYLDAAGHDPDGFAAAYALLGAARNLRILGIFARLALRDNKPRYLGLMPRVWDHVQTNLRHPALAPLARALKGVPPPSDAMIERLSAR
ncbi:tRNA (adenosine(37)-N6)-threonylcarbamoyltransferase complex ATPase subunit type 1 TsaE [Paracoccus bogoriensis]|uniref:tRNA (adenosine(37)-N6)-threonylcarbamoyltransferase complex ATPase subunit type 1 TsaE n=1 Tax=Paracoccus bogoriensis TaxID=242065 RepID=UPI001CA485F2|nr:tRNA (adenosine(37)-N6)-threonylcarbamoyltransferase complex ATPase subunit type 1 TsaE [Paracoccus bogoriensis]